jgi:hypothetical protein
MAGGGAERQFNLPPALSVRCWFNVVLTSSSLFIMPHAHSHHAVIEHHPRAHNIARIYEETFYIIIKNALSAPARFTPERLAGSAQSMRLFDDLAWKIAFRAFTKQRRKKHITFMFFVLRFRLLFKRIVLFKNSTLKNDEENILISALLFENPKK